MVMIDEQLCTVQDVAKRIGVHQETVRNWLRAGKLRGRRMSDRMGWRIPESEVRRFITEELLPDSGDGER